MTYSNPLTDFLTTANVGDTFKSGGLSVTVVAIGKHGPFWAITLEAYGDRWTTDYPANLRRETVLR